MNGSVIGNNRPDPPLFEHIMDPLRSLRRIVPRPHANDRSGLGVLEVGQDSRVDLVVRAGRGYLPRLEEDCQVGDVAVDLSLEPRRLTRIQALVFLREPVAERFSRGRSGSFMQTAWISSCDESGEAK
jgi:hypothetical protein